MPRIDVDQGAVLSSIVAALRTGVTFTDGYALTERTCFLSFYQEPYKFPDTMFVTVSPGRGVFPEGFQIGGGAKQCTEELIVAVTLWNRHPPNQIGHDATGLIDPVRGIYSLKSKVLRALAAQDIDANYPPGTGGQQTFLRQLLTIVDCDPPEHVKDEAGNNYSKLTLNCKVSWDWDLTS